MNDFEDRRREYFVALNHELDDFKVSYTELTIFFICPQQPILFLYQSGKHCNHSEAVAVRKALSVSN